MKRYRCFRNKQTPDVAIVIDFSANNTWEEALIIKVNNNDATIVQRARTPEDRSKFSEKVWLGVNIDGHSDEWQEIPITYLSPSERDKIELYTELPKDE